MNRRDIFKSLLGLTAVAIVAKGAAQKPKDRTTYNPNRAPRDTDDAYYDQWLHGKDEMHL